jgi:hypothetical protein
VAQPIAPLSPDVDDPSGRMLRRPSLVQFALRVFSLCSGQCGAILASAPIRDGADVSCVQFSALSSYIAVGYGMPRRRVQQLRVRALVEEESEDLHDFFFEERALGASAPPSGIASASAEMRSAGVATGAVGSLRPSRSALLPSPRALLEEPSGVPLPLPPSPARQTHWRRRTRAAAGAPHSPTQRVFPVSIMPHCAEASS